MASASSNLAPGVYICDIMVDEHPADKVVPGVVCAGLIIDDEGRILLVKAERWNNMYALPGGHIDLGERVIDAVKREMKEETNLDVDDIRFIRWGEFIFGKEFYEKRHFIYFHYSSDLKNKDVKLNDEAQSFIWVLPREALMLPITENVRDTATEYLKKQG